MSSAIVELFYVVSQALLLPVMVLVLVAMMFVVLMLGQTVREGIERKAWGGLWRTFLRDGRSSPPTSTAWPQIAKVGLPAWITRRLNGSDTLSKQLKLLIPQAELYANRHLTKLQVLARVGPMLGLAGTLIPLGPALQGLSSSNLDEVGNNLNVAFTTTVFGILVGGVAYALYSLHRTWYERDLGDIEYLLALLEEQNDVRETSPPVGPGEGRRSFGGNGESVRSLDRGGRGTDHYPDGSQIVT